MGKIEEWIQRVIKWGTLLALLIMGGVLILIVITAVARLLGYTLPGTFDLVETYMMVVGAFALAYCESLNAQAKAEVIIDRVSTRARVRFAVFTTFLTLVYWGVILWAGLRALADKIVRGERTDLLGVNIVPSRTLWMCAVALMFLFLVFKFFQHIKDAVTGEKDDASHAAKGVSE
ncbi:MAG TPA: TRAP transporter small permease [Syntrophorhabdaceae bacterium]|nr:TRAP transporter small permease [Syntrophorhabdaceae bacterium]